MADEREIGLHNLKPAKGSTHRRKRVGRGEGSGFGKTSGRGQKGAGSRAGAKDRSGIEGGQNPIQMRLRKLRGLSIAEVLGIDGAKANGSSEVAADAPAEETAAAGAETKS